MVRNYCCCIKTHETNIIFMSNVMDVVPQKQLSNAECYSNAVSVTQFLIVYHFIVNGKNN